MDMRYLITRFSIGFFLYLPFFTYAQVQTVGTFINSPLALESYTLVYTFTNNKVQVVNNCGQKIHEWNTDGKTLVAYLLPNGDLIKTAIDPAGVFGAGGASGYIERYNWDGALQWKYKLSNDSMILHHDIEVMPNGNILCNVWKKVPEPVVRNMGRDTANADGLQEIWDDVILELQPSGTNGAQVVWQWKSTDHLVQDVAPNKPDYGTVANSPELLNLNYRPEGIGNYHDWLHFNAIDYNPELDQIVISNHTFDEIFIIDHSTTSAQSAGHAGGMRGKGGDILYRWGNPEAYGKGSSSDRVFDGQHDPNWIKHGDYTNSIIVFNNNAGSSYSAVDIVTPSWDGMKYNLSENGRFLPSAPNYRYTKPTPSDLYSGIMSSAEVLENGNLYITEATKGKYTEYSIELDSVVWEYVNPNTATSFTKQGVAASQNISFRSYKYNVGYSAFAGKTLTPGAPLELDPWPTLCNAIDTTTPKDTTQDTTRHDTTNVGIFHLTLVGQAAVYPNPSTGKVSIKGLQNTQAVEVRDVLGNLVFSSKFDQAINQLDVDLTDLAQGTYYVTLHSDGYNSTSRLALLRQ
jgi:hypothetical protein